MGGANPSYAQDVYHKKCLVVLRNADRVVDIYIHGSVSRLGEAAVGEWLRLEYDGCSQARTLVHSPKHDMCTIEIPVGNLEHPIQLRRVPHVGLLKHGFGARRERAMSTSSYAFERYPRSPVTASQAYYSREASRSRSRGQNPLSCGRLFSRRSLPLQPKVTKQPPEGCAALTAAPLHVNALLRGTEASCMLM